MPIVGTQSLFKIIDFQARGPSVFLNRYWYIADTSPNSQAVANVFPQWEAQMSTTIVDCQPTNLVHTLTEIEEVTSLTNFGVFNSTQGSGTLVGTALPNFCAASFRLLRSSKETRGGFKRYAAGVEEVLAGNAWESTFLNVQLAVLGTQLAGNFNVGIVPFFPCIVRILYDINGDPLPASQWIYNPLSGIEVTNLVTTQNSRKLAVGI